MYGGLKHTGPSTIQRERVLANEARKEAREKVGIACVLEGGAPLTVRRSVHGG